MKDGSVLRIADVAPQSAAQRAKLRVDDRIVTIDGEPVMQRGLIGWREQLRERPVGTRLALGIRRGEAMIQSTLVLADRIPAHPPRKP